MAMAGHGSKGQQHFRGGEVEESVREWSVRKLTKGGGSGRPSSLNRGRRVAASFF